MFNYIIKDQYGNNIQSVTQWDLNQNLYIYGTRYDQAPIFQYSNQNSSRALNVQSEYDDDGVLVVAIPNLLLIQPYLINIYICISNESGARVVDSILLPVVSRPQPSDYEYEENVHGVDLLMLQEAVRNNSELLRGVLDAQLI